MTTNEIVLSLQKVRDGAARPAQSEIDKRICELKADAVNRGSEDEAKELWILEGVLRAQTQYLEAFRLLQVKKFYDAWCMLEQCEITMNAVQKHESDRWGSFLLDFIYDHVAKWQSIFPYKTFFSPEYLIHSKKCSICGARVQPRRGCNHKLGEIYGGAMCYHIITDAEPLSVSMVENPVQKYSVAFPGHPTTGEKGDFYNYSAVEYTISIVLTPFEPWSVETTTKLWPHSRFSDVGRNERCPCGSKSKYKRCCLPKDGVTMLHYLIHLSARPPRNLPSELLSRAPSVSKTRKSIYISTTV